MLNNTELRRLLRSLVDLVCEEAERNQVFAERLGRLLSGERPSKRRQNGRRTTPDPFQAMVERGPEGFRVWLESMQLAELKAIVRAHRLDTSRLSDKWKTKERFVELIVERVDARAKQGDVFRQYGVRRGERTEDVAKEGNTVSTGPTNEPKATDKA